MYPGRVAGAGDTFVTVECRGEDAVTNLMAAALERFGLDPTTAANDYRCSEILLDRGGESSLILQSTIMPKLHLEFNFKYKHTRIFLNYNLIFQYS